MQNPLTLLQEDRARAREQRDPCASLCTLANVDLNGAPQARTVILRDVGDELAVFVNATSPKFATVQNSPVSVVVWLPSQEVQYRLTCTTRPVEPVVVHESWQLRPHVPKQMDWFYESGRPQGSAITSREALLDALAGLELPDPLVAPAGARGLYLAVSVVDRLHLGQSNGVHDRRRYQRNSNEWSLQMLVP